MYRTRDTSRALRRRCKPKGALHTHAFTACLRCGEENFQPQAPRTGTGCSRSARAYCVSVDLTGQLNSHNMSFFSLFCCCCLRPSRHFLPVSSIFLSFPSSYRLSSPLRPILMKMHRSSLLRMMSSTCTRPIPPVPPFTQSHFS